MNERSALDLLREAVKGYRDSSDKWVKLNDTDQKRELQQMFIRIIMKFCLNTGVTDLGSAACEFVKVNVPDYSDDIIYVDVNTTIEQFLKLNEISQVNQLTRTACAIVTRMKTSKPELYERFQEHYANRAKWYSLIEQASSSLNDGVVSTQMSRLFSMLENSEGDTSRRLKSLTSFMSEDSTDVQRMSKILEVWMWKYKEGEPTDINEVLLLNEMGPSKVRGASFIHERSVWLPSGADLQYLSTITGMTFVDTGVKKIGHIQLLENHSCVLQTYVQIGYGFIRGQNPDAPGCFYTTKGDRFREECEKAEDLDQLCGEMIEDGQIETEFILYKISQRIKAAAGNLFPSLKGSCIAITTSMSVEYEDELGKKVWKTKKVIVEQKRKKEGFSKPTIDDKEFIEAVDLAIEMVAGKSYGHTGNYNSALKTVGLPLSESCINWYVYKMCIQDLNQRLAAIGVRMEPEELPIRFRITSKGKSDNKKERGRDRDEVMFFFHVEYEVKAEKMLTVEVTCRSLNYDKTKLKLNSGEEWVKCVFEATASEIHPKSMKMFSNKNQVLNHFIPCQHAYNLKTSSKVIEEKTFMRGNEKWRGQHIRVVLEAPKISTPIVTNDGTKMKKQSLEAHAPNIMFSAIPFEGDMAKETNLISTQQYHKVTANESALFGKEGKQAEKIKERRENLLKGLINTKISGEEISMMKWGSKYFYDAGRRKSFDAWFYVLENNYQNACLHKKNGQDYEVRMSEEEMEANSQWIPLLLSVRKTLSNSLIEMTELNFFFKFVMDDGTSINFLLNSADPDTMRGRMFTIGGQRGICINDGVATLFKTEPGNMKNFLSYQERTPFIYALATSSVQVPNARFTLDTQRDTEGFCLFRDPETTRQIAPARMQHQVLFDNQAKVPRESHPLPQIGDGVKEIQITIPIVIGEGDLREDNDLRSLRLIGGRQVTVREVTLKGDGSDLYSLHHGCCQDAMSWFGATGEYQVMGKNTVDGQITINGQHWDIEVKCSQSKSRAVANMMGMQYVHMLKFGQTYDGIIYSEELSELLDEPWKEDKAISVRQALISMAISWSKWKQENLDFAAYSRAGLPLPSGLTDEIKHVFTDDGTNVKEKDPPYLKTIENRIIARCHDKPEMTAFVMTFEGVAGKGKNSGSSIALCPPVITEGTTSYMVASVSTVPDVLNVADLEKTVERLRIKKDRHQIGKAVALTTKEEWLLARMEDGSLTMFKASAQWIPIRTRFITTINDSIEAVVYQHDLGDVWPLIEKLERKEITPMQFRSEMIDMMGDVIQPSTWKEAYDLTTMSMCTATQCTVQEEEDLFDDEEYEWEDRLIPPETSINFQYVLGGFKSPETQRALMSRFGVKPVEVENQSSDSESDSDIELPSPSESNDDESPEEHSEEHVDDGAQEGVDSKSTQPNPFESQLITGWEYDHPPKTSATDDVVLTRDKVFSMPKDAARVRSFIIKPPQASITEDHANWDFSEYKKRSELGSFFVPSKNDDVDISSIIPIGPKGDIMLDKAGVEEAKKDLRNYQDLKKVNQLYMDKGHLPVVSGLSDMLKKKNETTKMPPKRVPSTSVGSKTRKKDNYVEFKVLNMYVTIPERLANFLKTKRVTEQVALNAQYQAKRRDTYEFTTQFIREHGGEA